MPPAAEGRAKAAIPMAVNPKTTLYIGSCTVSPCLPPALSAQRSFWQTCAVVGSVYGPGASWQPLITAPVSGTRVEAARTLIPSVAVAPRLSHRQRQLRFPALLLPLMQVAWRRA